MPNKLKDQLLGRFIWYYSLFNDKNVFNFVQKRFNKNKIQLVLMLIGQAAYETISILRKGKQAYYEKLPDIGIAFFSQNKEELIIRSFFQEKRGGFFLDVGSAWPFADNNTFLLEKQFNWKGLAIDANPDYNKTWKNLRSTCSLFTFVVSNETKSLEKFYKAGGLGSTQKERRFGKKIIRGKEVNIPAITLNKLLDENGVEKIDFLSMDIEQSEVRALQGFDIARFKPDLVCIECTVPVRAEILAYFELNNYELIESYMHYKSHWYFKPKMDCNR